MIGKKKLGPLYFIVGGQNLVFIPTSLNAFQGAGILSLLGHCAKENAVDHFLILIGNPETMTTIAAGPEHLGAEIGFLHSGDYFAVTALEADPPRLLRTVMFCGFDGQENSPLYRPPPSFRSVPISAFVDVTYKRSVAVELVLVASTRNCPFEYSARCTATVSVDAELVTVNVAVRVTPPKAPVIVTAVELVPDTVPMANVALSAPAATLTLEGTLATAGLLLVKVMTPPPLGAALVNVTVPCAELPPTTLDGLIVRADNVGGSELAACGVKVRVADQAPATPAELTPRTRHHSLRAGRVPAVNLEMLTLVFTTNGEPKLFESSI